MKWITWRGRHIPIDEDGNIAKKKENGFVPRAKGAKTFEEHGVAFRDSKTNERFSDYLRNKYGTDDIDIIKTGTSHTAKSLRDDFNKKSYEEYLANYDYDRNKTPGQKMHSMMNEYAKKTPKERAREIDEANNEIKEGNPIKGMVNERIKEKNNTLNNDKIMLDYMKKKNIKEIQGMSQKDFENRINKNEEYLKTATNSQKEFHYAGEELYSDDPNRFGDKLRKYNDKMNPTKKDDIRVKRYPDDPNNKEYINVKRDIDTSQTKTFNLKTNNAFGGVDLGEWEGKTFEEAKNNFLKENPSYSNGKYGNITGSEKISNKMTPDFAYELLQGEKKSLEFTKDNLARRKKNGDTVENLSNYTRQLHERELAVQKAEHDYNRAVKNNDISPMSEFSDTTGKGISDRQNKSLSSMSMSGLRQTAQEFGINTTGLSKQQLMAKIIAIMNNSR